MTRSIYLFICMVVAVAVLLGGLVLRGDGSDDIKESGAGTSLINEMPSTEVHQVELDPESNTAVVDISGSVAPVTEGQETVKAEETVTQPAVTIEPGPTVTSLSVPNAGVAKFSDSLGHFTCSDCFYAAVDKDHQLASTYSPVVTGTGLSGDGYLRAEAKEALSQLFMQTKEEGMEVRIISAYRSYNTQANTFNYWVNLLMDRDGLNQQAAETKANTFSAHAGESEHQLGTTADISLVGAAAFDATANAELYDFIEKEAYKFGFVLSYPIGQEHLTGYVHEPWHIRYVGVALATELYDTGYIAGNGVYSTEFLRQKGLSQ